MHTLPEFCERSLVFMVFLITFARNIMPVILLLKLNRVGSHATFYQRLLSETASLNVKIRFSVNFSSMELA